MTDSCDQLRRRFGLVTSRGRGNCISTGLDGLRSKEAPSRFSSYVERLSVCLALGLVCLCVRAVPVGFEPPGGG
jgi:hypothetical protein